MPQDVVNSISNSYGTHSYSPFASDQAQTNLNQLAVVQVQEVRQRATRPQTAPILHRVRRWFDQQYPTDQFRKPLPRLRAPIRWLNTPARTLREMGGSNAQQAQFDAALPRLRVPSLNEQWIDQVTKPDYRGGF